MELLGLPLLVVLGAFTLGLPVLTYVLWGRWRGPRAVRGVQRGAMIALSQVAAVLLVAAALNDYGYFYSSWSDLVGAAPSTGRAVHVPPGAGRHARVGAAFSAAASTRPAGSGPTTAHVDLHWAGPAQWPVKGRLESLTIAGSRSGLDAPAMVYLPPQYFQPAYAHRAFPAVEVLTGYPGSMLALVNRLDYPAHLLAQITAGRSRPMVLVMMRPTVAPPRDTECTDVPAGPQALTYLAQDVPAALRATLRVDPLGWGVIGDSTGGYCAAKIAMTHSDVFSAAVALSGYFHTLQDGTTGDLWGGSAVLRQLNDLEWRLAHLPAPPVSLLVTASRGERGPTGYGDTRRFLSLVRPPMQVDSVIVSHGGHNFATWSAELPGALDWLSAHLPAPAA